MTDTAASGSRDKKDPLYAPGIKRRPRGAGDARYWLPPPKDAKAGFDPKCVTFPLDLSELEVAARCRKYWADLDVWRDKLPKGPARYTFSWLVDRYTGDEFSPFQRLGFKSKRNYKQDCEIIRATIGDIRIDAEGEDRILGEDVWYFHSVWGQPVAKIVDGKTVLGAPRPSRARHVVTQFRMLIRYGITLGVPGAKALADILEAMAFPTTKARKGAPEFAHMMAVVEQALKEGYRSIAMTTLAQFEFTERRISIMGSWEGDHWRPGWVWSGIQDRLRVGISADWIITYTQNKRGEVVREYDLKDTPLLLELLQQTPAAERAGPIMICETTGRPWKDKHYTDTFRDLARLAGLPDDVWSMDMRAGAATEADGIVGITLEDMKAAGGWKGDSVNRYRRAPQRRAQNVVKLRQKAREQG